MSAELIRLEPRDQAAVSGAIRRGDADFLPASLEVLEKPPNPFGRLVLWLMMAFIALAFLWSVFGRVDVVATAQGRVVPIGQVKVIQPVELGVVRAIHVGNGQRVEAGQPLIELDPTVSGAELAQARESLHVAELDRARALALVAAITEVNADADGLFTPPENLDPQIAKLQAQLVQARIAEHRSTTASLKQQVAQRRHERAMVGAEVSKLEGQLPLLRQQYESLAELARQGLAPSLRVAELGERLIGMEGDLAIRRSELLKATAAMEGVAGELARAQAEFARTALDALNEAEAAVALRSEELRKAEDRSRSTLLEAPETGIVHGLSVHTIGGVVRPADPLLVIVPEGGDLVVEVRVLNRDAGFVRIGDPVEIKLEAFPFTRYGVLEGHIDQIGNDAIEDEQLGLVFPARVRLKTTSLNADGRLVTVTPGLSATAEIKTGQRRIISYLLSPIAKRVDEAGRER